MKKIILFLALLLAISCGQHGKSVKIDCMEIVQEYLDSTYSIISPVVTEVSELDSMYTPFHDLISLKLRYSQVDLELAKLYSELVSAKTIREIDQIQDKALSFVAEISTLDSLTTRAMLYCDHPEFGKNRRAVKAKYTANGKVGEAYFFFNNYDNTIGHTSIQNYNELKEVISMQMRVSSAIREFK